MNIVGAKLGLDPMNAIALFDARTYGFTEVT
jgi:hypothetical protein